MEHGSVFAAMGTFCNSAELCFILTDCRLHQNLCVGLRQALPVSTRSGREMLKPLRAQFLTIGCLRLGSKAMSTDWPGRSADMGCLTLARLRQRRRGGEEAGSQRSAQLQQETQNPLQVSCSIDRQKN